MQPRPPAPPALRTDLLVRDPEVVHPSHPPTLLAFTAPSHGADLLGCLYVADGPGPHPTVLLLHGCPGNERHLDLAHALRRTGVNVALVHYRGAWGSPGRFTIGRAVEDTRAALAFLRSDALAEAGRIDPERVIPVGHSMGGFCALMAAADDPAVPAVAGLAAFNFGVHARMMRQVPAVRQQTLDQLAPLMPPLAGATAEALVAEMDQHRAAWDIRDRAAALAGRPVLLVAAERDATGPPLLHHAPLVEAMEAAGARALTARTLDADHVFSARRVALADAVARWIGSALDAPRTLGAP